MRPARYFFIFLAILNQPIYFMKKIILSLSLIFAVNTYAQIQISDFTYDVEPLYSPFDYTESNGRLYFAADDATYGAELWSTNGTPEDVNLVGDTNAGTSDGLHYGIKSAVLNNELYFIANTPYDSMGGEIWKANADGFGAEMVITFTGNISGLTTVNDEIFYITGAQDTGLHLWKTDGTQEGTTLVKDLDGMGGASYQGTINGKFIFTLGVQSSYSRMWRSDGTSEGTFYMTEPIDGNGSGGGGTDNLSQFITYDNNLYFVSRYHLFRTDGTAAYIVNNVWNAQTNTVQFSDVTVANNKMYFLFYSQDLKKISIYESNGTSSGTSLVYSKTTNTYFYPSNLVVFGNNLRFTSANENGGTSLFSFDTTSHVTSEITELPETEEPPFFIGGYSACLIEQISDTKYFFNLPGAYVPQRSGWIYDSSTDGLTQFAVLDNLLPDHYTIFNQDLYYTKSNQVWKFDINSLSTQSLSDDLALSVYPNPSSDMIYFDSTEKIDAIDIYDVRGKLVMSCLNTSQSINISKLNSGIYFVKVSLNGKITTRKIIKV